MRGAGDEWTVGERIAFYRRRRGLTQRELAGLVGRSEEWVSSVERGRRQVRRLDRLITMAGALRVELPDLLGQPVLMEDEAGDDDVPAVRDALMTPRRLSRLLYGSDEPDTGRAMSLLARDDDATGLPVRCEPRLPGQPSPHPKVDSYAVVPATANSVAKLALGIADNQALTQVGEALGVGIPVVLFPRINAAHARHPAWTGHLAALRGAGVQLVYDDEVWPLHEPRSAPERDLPWTAILDAIRTATSAP